MTGRQLTGDLLTIGGAAAVTGFPAGSGEVPVENGHQENHDADSDQDQRRRQSDPKPRRAPPITETQHRTER